MPSEGADDRALSMDRRTLERMELEPSVLAPPLATTPASDVHCGCRIAQKVARLEGGLLEVGPHSSFDCLRESALLFSRPGPKCTQGSALKRKKRVLTPDHFTSSRYVPHSHTNQNTISSPKVTSRRTSLGVYVVGPGRRETYMRHLPYLKRTVHHRGHNLDGRRDVALAGCRV